MTDETSPAAGPVCARESCGRPVPESLGTRPRRYCSRNCRQRAYEERRLEAQVREARAAALAAALRGATSRDRAGTSRDAPQQPPEQEYFLMGGVAMPIAPRRPRGSA